MKECEYCMSNPDASSSPPKKKGGCFELHCGCILWKSNISERKSIPIPMLIKVTFATRSVLPAKRGPR